MYTRHHVCYEIYNHEIGTLAFFEHYENVIRWKEDNAKDSDGYREYGLKLITSSETDVEYWEGV